MIATFTPDALFAYCVERNASGRGAAHQTGGLFFGAGARRSRSREFLVWIARKPMES
jgi:hypothetical protein